MDRRVKMYLVCTTCVVAGMMLGPTTGRIKIALAAVGLLMFTAGWILGSIHQAAEMEGRRE